MDEPKNQHYIPQSYLRGFAEKRKDEFYVFVRFYGEKFHETNIRNICSENYFYTIPDATAKNKNLIEKYYSQNIDSLYPEIQNIICNDSKTEINNDERIKIINGILNLYFRTPRFLKYYENHINALVKAFDDYYLGITERHKIEFFDKIIDFQQVDYDKFKKSISDKTKQLFLSQHIKLFNDFVEYKKNDGIGISKIEDDSEYITSDNPVIIRNPSGTAKNIFALSNVIMLPINKKYLITIIPKAEQSMAGKFLRISASFDDVVGVNDDIERNSEKWIIGSKDGIHNHLEKVNKINTDFKEGSEFAKRLIQKRELLKPLDAILSSNGGVINQEFISKILELSKAEIMKDDVNMVRYLKELKRDGFIKDF